MRTVWVFVCEEVVIVFDSSERLRKEFPTLTWVDDGARGRWVARVADNLSAYMYCKEIRE